VLGEVARPGTLSVDAAPTLGQALCQAGGATVFASRRVVVRRKYDPTRIVATPVARTDEDYPLQAGDQITVEPICGGY
jgi:protein involved in polysaccharide export with SLBB domain